MEVTKLGARWSYLNFAAIYESGDRFIVALTFYVRFFNSKFPNSTYYLKSCVSCVYNKEGRLTFQDIGLAQCATSVQERNRYNCARPVKGNSRIIIKTNGYPEGLFICTTGDTLTCSKINTVLSYANGYFFGYNHNGANQSEHYSINGVDWNEAAVSDSRGGKFCSVLYHGGRYFFINNSGIGCGKSFADMNTTEFIEFEAGTTWSGGNYTILVEDTVFCPHEGYLDMITLMVSDDPAVVEAETLSAKAALEKAKAFTIGRIAELESRIAELEDKVNALKH